LNTKLQPAAIEANSSGKAGEAYRRFVGYWKDGDLDRDRVAEAQRKISS